MWIIGENVQIINLHCGKPVRNKINEKELIIMKKLMAASAVAFVICTSFTGCGSNVDSSGMNDSSSSTSEAEKTEATATTEKHDDDSSEESREERDDEDVTMDDTGSNSTSEGYVGGVVDGVESAGEDIIDGAGDAVDDIADGIMGDDENREDASDNTEEDNR
jgi:hypothetical protein